MLRSDFKLYTHAILIHQLFIESLTTQREKFDACGYFKRNIEKTNELKNQMNHELIFIVQKLKHERERSMHTHVFLTTFLHLFNATSINRLLII